MLPSKSGHGLNLALYDKRGVCVDMHKQQSLPTLHILTKKCTSFYAKLSRPGTDIQPHMAWYTLCSRRLCCYT